MTTTTTNLDVRKAILELPINFLSTPSGSIYWTAHEDDDDVEITVTSALGASHVVLNDETTKPPELWQLEGCLNVWLGRQGCDGILYTIRALNLKMLAYVTEFNIPLRENAIRMADEELARAPHWIG